MLPSSAIFLVPVSVMGHGMDFWETDLWNFSPSTFDRCTKLFKAVTSCKALIYQPSSKTCWPKCRRGGNHGPSLVPGLISANMGCDYKSDHNIPGLTFQKLLAKASLSLDITPLLLMVARADLKFNP